MPSERKRKDPLSEDDMNVSDERSPKKLRGTNREEAQGEPRRSARARKSVDRLGFTTPTWTYKPRKEIVKGHGEALGSFDAFAAYLKKMTANDEACRNLYRVLYNSPGKATTRKSKINAWTGIQSTDLNADKLRMDRLIDRWSKNEVITLASVLGLSRKTKGEAKDNILEFLINPQVSNNQQRKSAPTDASVSQSKSKSSGGERKKNAISKKPTESEIVGEVEDSDVEELKDTAERDEKKEDNEAADMQVDEKEKQEESDDDDAADMQVHKKEKEESDDDDADDADDAHDEHDAMAVGKPVNTVEKETVEKEDTFETKTYEKEEEIEAETVEKEDTFIDKTDETEDEIEAKKGEKEEEIDAETGENEIIKAETGGKETIESETCENNVEMHDNNMKDADTNAEVCNTEEVKAESEGYTEGSYDLDVNEREMNGDESNENEINKEIITGENEKDDMNLKQKEDAGVDSEKENEEAKSIQSDEHREMEKFVTTEVQIKENENINESKNINENENENENDNQGQSDDDNMDCSSKEELENKNLENTNEENKNEGNKNEENKNEENMNEEAMRQPVDDEIENSTSDDNQNQTNADTMMDE